MDEPKNPLKINIQCYNKNKSNFNSNLRQLYFSKKVNTLLNTVLLRFLLLTYSII